MRRRMFIIIGLVGIVIVVAILILRGVGNIGGTRTPTPTPVVSKTIIYAAQDIPQGTVITDAHIQQGQWPQNIAYENLVTDGTAIVGKRARIDIKRGEPVLSTSILGEGDLITEPGSLTASKIAPGKVAIAVPLSRLAGVANAIRNGDHIVVIASMLFVDLDANSQSLTPLGKLILGVDKDLKLTTIIILNGESFKESPLTDVVLGAYLVPFEPQRPRLVSAVIVSNAKVLNVGNVTDGNAAVAEPTPAAGGSKATVAPVVNPDILVIEVTPEEAISLDFILRLHGDLTYALRAIGDTTTISLPSWDLKRLMENRKIDLPSKPNYGAVPRNDVLFVPVLGNDVVVQAR
jgi:Flp pilus assembly protein CpaB